MAKKFKDYYDLDCARLIADKLRQVKPGFPARRFVADLERTLPPLEFLARQDAFADDLPDDYADNLGLFERILGPELATSEGMFTHGWWLWPVGRYVERHGPEDFERSLRFVSELTKRFTGEFAVRPLIAHAPEKALRVIARWSRDANVHVRRLASEGLRPRLPWAKKLTVALDHFAAYQAILSNLKADPERFVQPPGAGRTSTASPSGSPTNGHPRTPRFRPPHEPTNAPGSPDYLAASPAHARAVLRWHSGIPAQGQRQPPAP